MTTKPALIPNVDYTINSDGYLVFSKKYLLDRGYCCQSGCLHCPYNYQDNIDPNVPPEFSDVWEDENQLESDDDEEDD